MERGRQLSKGCDAENINFFIPLAIQPCSYSGQGFASLPCVCTKISTTDVFLNGEIVFFLYQSSWPEVE